MSILKNNNTVTRFKVSGELKNPDNLGIINVIQKEFDNFVFKDVTIDEESSWGFTSTLSPFFPNFNDSSFITGNYITASIRIDKKMIPAKLVAKERIIAEKKLKESTGQEFLAKTQKSEIKDIVVGNLLAEAKPIPNIFDFVWNVDDGVIFFYTSNKQAIEILEEMFHECFGVRAVAMFPFIMAEQVVGIDRVVALKPSTFL